MGRNDPVQNCRYARLDSSPPAAGLCNRTGRPEGARYGCAMPKKLTTRLDDEFAADTEALTRAGGNNLNETISNALQDAVARRREDPAFHRRVRRIIEEDQELVERLAE